MKIKDAAKKWQKGKTGNPKGSSIVQRLRGDIKRLTHEQVADVGSLLVNGKMADITKITQDKDASLLEVWTATLIIKSMGKGDSHSYERILNRIIGKVPERIELTGRNGEPLHLQSMEKMEAELKAIRQAREETGDD